MKLATYVRKLKDRSGNYVVPATRSTGVYLNNNHTLQSWIDNMEDEKFDILTVYPVGAIFQSTSNTSPASLFGGSWEQIQNRFLYGSGAKNVGDTGGEENHWLSINEIPAHNHNGISTKWQSWASNGPTCGPVGGSNFIVDANGPFTTNNSGGGQAHNNMPPYYVCNIWRRTA